MTLTDNDRLPGLCLIGGGQMGRALVGGMIDRDLLRASDLVVVDPSPESHSWWREHHADADIVESVDKATAQETVMVAVKPDVVKRVATASPKAWSEKLVVSVAAGVSLSSLKRWFGHDRVVRVMPNTPCLVGCGASAFCIGHGVTEADHQRVRAMLESVGIAAEVKESQMDAVTGLSGSGPAYIFTMIEGLADGGVLAGLPRDLAMRLATQTVAGAAAMVKETGQHPGQLKDAVASPAGTTIAGLNVLEQNAVRGTLAGAVQTAARRSKELGQADVS